MQRYFDFMAPLDNWFKFIFIKRCLFTLSDFIQDSANIDKVIIKQKKLTVILGYSEYNC